MSNVPPSTQLSLAPSCTRRASQSWATPSRWHSCPGKVAPQPGDLLAAPLASAGPSSLPSKASPSRQAFPRLPHSRSSTIPAPPLQSCPHTLPAARGQTAHPPKTTATGRDSSPGALRWAQPCHLPLPFCLQHISGAALAPRQPGRSPLVPREDAGMDNPSWMLLSRRTSFRGHHHRQGEVRAPCLVLPAAWHCPAAMGCWLGTPWFRMRPQGAGDSQGTAFG